MPPQHAESLPTGFLSLSLHVHMAQISVAEGPLRCDAMVFASLLWPQCPYQESFESAPIRGRTYLFVSWPFGIGFTLKNGQYCVNSWRRAKEVDK